MPGDFSTICELSINGTDLTDDVQDVEEGEYSTAVEVETMGAGGTADVKPKYNINFTYVVPSDKSSRFDFDSVRNATLKIKDDGGATTVYTGVRTLKVGSGKRDRSNPLSKQITLWARKKVAA
ncbi:MAG: hypothetical protein EHM48_10610 [Planctomycetaceae bacterium]|nr:MAG: hypothetical protein EHM48_10610 [Planctomycetaceae bacterium]